MSLSGKGVADRGGATRRNPAFRGVGIPTLAEPIAVVKSERERLDMSTKRPVSSTDDSTPFPHPTKGSGMVFVPHTRVTFGGTFGAVSTAVEQWSFRFNLNGVATPDTPGALANVLKDAWQTHLAARCRSRVRLTQVKVANINAEGKYAGATPPGIWTGDIAATGADNTLVPNQVALAISLTTGLRGPSSRGRFYLPLPVYSADTDGRLDAASVNTMRTAAVAFLDAVNLAASNATPLSSRKVGILSRNGTNPQVTGVRVGKVPDTMRSRRRSMLEEHSAHSRARLMVTAAELQARWGVTPHAALHGACLLAAHPDLRITSGRRTPERNRAVGGVQGSFHLRGRALDFAGSRGTLAAALRTARCQRVSCGCTGPEEAIDEGDHLHVAW